MSRERMSRRLAERAFWRIVCETLTALANALRRWKLDCEECGE